MKNDLEEAEISCLTADIGGTNVRFGVTNSDPENSHRPAIKDQKIYPCSSFDSIDVAMETYRQHIGAPLPEVACMAVAGPVKNNIVRMTNRNWLISGNELTNRFGFERVIILNDAEAIACATRVIGDTELKTVKSGDPIEETPAAVITAGTGVGVAAIAPIGDHWFPLASEAGHVTLAPQSPKEVAIFEKIQTGSTAISAELLLSGEGIRRLYFAVAAVAGAPAKEATSAEITQAALDQTDEIAIETLNVYSSLLGSYAGDIALTFGARNGIYLAGNVLRQVEPILSDSPFFRESFENKGAMLQYLSEVPVNLITLEEPGLVGASTWFNRSMAVA